MLVNTSYYSTSHYYGICSVTSRLLRLISNIASTTLQHIENNTSKYKYNNNKMYMTQQTLGLRTQFVPEGCSRT